MISIAMATYNGEKYLREQLDSILAQSIQDFELIVCDDCSTDSTVKILNEYAVNDKRIKVFINTVNLGFKKNFEKAMHFCTGEYIAFSDQDDIWFSEHLEILLKNIDDNFLVCANSELYNKERTQVKMSETLTLDFIPMKDQFFYLLYNNFVQGAAMMINSKLLQYVNEIPENNGFFHDHWLALYAAYYEKLIYIDQSILFYRQHTGTVTTNKKKNLCTILQQTKQNTIYKDRISCLLDFKQEIANNTNNKYLKEAIDYYTNNKLYKIKYLIKNYKRMYSVKTNKYLIFRIFKIILGVTR